jgi:hypothetical protein
MKLLKWLKREISDNVPASVPVLKINSVLSLIFILRGRIS